MKSVNNHIGTKPDEVEVRNGSVAEHLVEERFSLNTWIQEHVKDAPWWGISIAFHLIVLLVFAAIIMSETREEQSIIKTIRLPFQEPKKLDMKKPTNMYDSQKLSKEKSSAEDLVWKNAEVSDHNETADNKDSQDCRGESLDFLSDKHPLSKNGVFDVIGLGIGPGGPYGRPDGGGRINRVSKTSKSDRRTVPSTRKALWWLARHQNPDGSWGAVSFQHQCKDTRCSGTGNSFFDIGLTGLALLAFTGATYTPGSKDYRYTDGRTICYGDVVRKAALYLKDIQRADGAFGPPTEGKFMYNHAVASYALADLVALMKDKGESAGAVLFENSAQKAIDFIVNAQNPGKAWRYHPRCGDNDVSVTGWCAMALKAAEEGGLNVPDTIWSGIKSHLDDVTDSAYGQVGYIQKSGVAIVGREADAFHSGKLYIPPSLTAVGIMMRIFMGERKKSEVIRNGAGLLLQNLPVWDTSIKGKIDYYYWFYGSYALNQYDGPKGFAWTKWNEAMKDVLVKNQRQKKDGCVNGSWDPIDRWSDESGRVYSTAISVLTLEVYYRLRIVMGH